MAEAVGGGDGVTLDHCVLVFLFFCLLYGIARGLLRQAVALAALAAGLLAAWLVSFTLSRMFRLPPVSGSFLYSAAGTVVFVLLYVVIVRRGRKACEEKAVVFSGSPGDRLLGGILALLKGLVVLLVAVWLFDAVGAAWLKAHPGGAALWNGSRLVQWCRGHNVLDRFASVRRLKGLFTAASSEEARRRLSAQPAYERMISNPRYKAVKEDDSLTAALKELRWAAVLKNGKLQALLRDDSFWNDFIAVRWEGAAEREPYGGGAGGAMVSVTPAPAPTATPLRKTPTPPPAGLSKVFLKNGSLIEGRIESEDSHGVVIEVFMPGGSLKMSLTRGEIDRIERPLNTPAAGH